MRFNDEVYDKVYHPQSTANFNTGGGVVAPRQKADQKEVKKEDQKDDQKENNDTPDEAGNDAIENAAPDNAGSEGDGDGTDN